MGWSRFFRRAHWDDERHRELQAYLDIETDDNVARGMSAEDARRAARRKLGNPTLIREEIYRMNTIGFVERLAQDLRFALRLLRKSPGFALVAVLSLALGIGVNTAMFSVVHAVLLRALPYPRPAELVRVALRDSAGALSVVEYRFVKEHSRLLSAVAGYRGAGERRLGAEWVTTMTVTTDFLRTLEVRPSLGREFDADETLPGGPQAIVLTDALWRRSFGGDPGVVGRAVRLDDTSFTVVGVLPPGFWFPQRADALVPLRPTGSLGDLGANTQVVARLREGVSIGQAQAEMASLSDGLRRAQAGDVTASNRGLAATPLHASLVGEIRSNVWLLFGATGLLLLIACSNLGTLLLTRLAARGREFALRLALGGSRGRLMSQFLVENLVLASLGAAAGLFAAAALIRALVAWMPFELPASTPVALNGAALAFTLAVALGTSVALTFVPLVTTRRLNLNDALKSTGRTAGHDAVRSHTRNVLVVAEVALSTTLLVAAGLLIQSLYRLQQERLGFATQGLVTFETPLAPERRPTAARSSYTDAVLERLRAVPGVTGVAATNVLPLTGQSNLPTQRDGRPEQSIGGMEIRAVTPAYFDLMGIPVRQGRTFTEADRETSEPVAVVNETVARRWWAREGAVGDRLQIGRFQGREFLKDPPRSVVGVVGDTKTMTLQEAARPTVFVPMRQALSTSNLAWIVKADAGPGLAEDLRRAVAGIDSSQRVRRLRPMAAVVSTTTASPRFNAQLFGVFAGVAVLLAAVGLYGVLSFLVAQRFQEIGTRMALGAGRADVLTVFLKQGLALTTSGLALGLGGALAVTRWLSTLLYGVGPRDPWSFAAISLLLLAVGLGASLIPAYRATRIDPIKALRCE